MKKKITLDLASDPGTKLTIPDADDGDFPLGHTLLAVAAALGVLAWTLFTMKSQAPPEEWRPSAAAQVLKLGIEDAKRDAAAQARVMADDARVRTILATPGIDRGTIEDVLGDMAKASSMTAVAIFDGSGKVTALVGPKELGDIDLAATKLSDAMPTRIWALGKSVMVVAVAPVNLGDRTPVLLCAKTVTKESLEPVRKAISVSIGVGVENQIVLSSLERPEDQGVLASAAEGRLDPTREVLVEPLDPGPRSPVVVAVAPPPTEQTSSALMWFPLLLIVVNGLGSVVLAARR